MTRNLQVTFDLRKSLTTQVGDQAGNHVADLLQEMIAEIEDLKRNKVTVTRLVPVSGEMKKGSDFL